MSEQYNDTVYLYLIIGLFEEYNAGNCGNMMLSGNGWDIGKWVGYRVLY
jgi:hypothetical protein